MIQYLLDTNTLIYFLKGEFELEEKFTSIGSQNLFVSEITIAELRFGASNSLKSTHNHKVVDKIIQSYNILPIWNSLTFYGNEKSRLRKKGLSIDEFDLLIGCSAVQNNLILATRNVKHFKNIKNNKIENWMEEKNT